MKRLYPVLFIVFIGLITLGVIMAGASARTFLNLPSVLIVLLVAATLSLCSFTPAEITHFFSIAFAGRAIPESEVRDGIVFFRALQWYLIVAGIIGFLIGVISILSALGSSSSIGSGTAIALLTVFYSLVLAAGIAVPFRVALERLLTGPKSR